MNEAACSNDMLSGIGVQPEAGATTFSDMPP